MDHISKAHEVGGCLFSWKYSLAWCLLLILECWYCEVENHKFCILLSPLGLGHHHLAELIKVHRARAVLVQLLQYALKKHMI